MKKIIVYCVCTIITTVIVQSLLTSYCLNNVSLNVTTYAKEKTYPEYSDKIMGLSGIIKNRTIFPIKVKNISPIDGRGVEYISTVVTEWGFSEISKDDLFNNYEALENKKIGPLTEYDIGYFYLFTGEYMVNPNAFEFTYSIFGIDFKKIEIDE